MMSSAPAEFPVALLMVVMLMEQHTSASYAEIAMRVKRTLFPCLDSRAAVII